MPSEFKTCWEELVKVLILDAFPDFMDKFQLLVPLAQEILIILIESINTLRDEKLIKVGEILNIDGDDDGMNYLDVKTKSIFQEYSLKIFQFNDEFYQNLVFEKYLPRCKSIIDAYEDDEDEDYMELLEEAINSDDFKNFVQSLHKIVLHICLSDPPITLDLVPQEERVKKDTIFDKYEFKKFKKHDMFCIDGFPKEDLPAVVVYPPPMKGKYVYQGIRPSVITLPDADEEIVEYVGNLKEEMAKVSKVKSIEVDKDDEERDNKDVIEEKQQVEEKQIVEEIQSIEEKVVSEIKQVPEVKQKTEENSDKKKIELDQINIEIDSKSPPPSNPPKTLIPTLNHPPSCQPTPKSPTLSPRNPPVLTPILPPQSPKERLISPVPKPISNISKSPINIKNQKDQILKKENIEEFNGKKGNMEDMRFDELSTKVQPQGDFTPTDSFKVSLLF